MKHLILIFILAILSTTMVAQRPPGKVRKAFEQMYPGYEKVSWTSEGDRTKEWTVRFHVQSDSIIATYDAKANWIITLTFITVEDLPQAVIDGILDEYAGVKIILAARLEEPGFDGYGAAFNYKKDRWGVQVSKEGKVLRRKLTAEGFEF